MNIDDKDLAILNTLIYDKRTKESGILSEMQIIKGVGGYLFGYRAYFNTIRAERYVFREDIVAGNVIFLLPFDITHSQSESELYRDHKLKAIKKFLGDDYRDDLVWEISEEERQKEIRKWDELRYSWENWSNFLKDENGDYTCPL